MYLCHRRCHLLHLVMPALERPEAKNVGKMFSKRSVRTGAVCARKTQELFEGPTKYSVYNT